jgi:hypothetical protein
MNKYNIFADPLCFEIKNRRQGPKTAGYRRKPAAISNPGHVGCKLFKMVNITAIIQDDNFKLHSLVNVMKHYRKT